MKYSFIIYIIERKTYFQCIHFHEDKMLHLCRVSTETAPWRILTAPCTRWEGISVSWKWLWRFSLRWRLRVLLLTEPTRVASPYVMNRAKTKIYFSGASAVIRADKCLLHTSQERQWTQLFTLVAEMIELFSLFWYKHKPWIENPKL